MEIWITLVFAALAGLVGVIYWAGQRRDDKQDDRFDTDENEFNEHIKEDRAAHERIARVEERVIVLETEQTTTRKHIHDLRAEVSKTLSGWYLEILKLINRDVK